MTDSSSPLRVPQFGAILFRSAELIGQQGSEALDALGIDFDARHTSILLVLHKYGAQTSSDLAGRIGHSRQLIEARLKSPRGRAAFISKPDPDDTRRRLYDIADAARPVAQDIHDIMLDFETVYDRLWQEIGVDLETALLSMEKRLGETPLIDRLVEVSPDYAPRAGRETK